MEKINNWVIDLTHKKSVNINSLKMLKSISKNQYLFINGGHSKFKKKEFILQQQDCIIERWLNRNVIWTIEPKPIRVKRIKKVKV